MSNTLFRALALLDIDLNESLDGQAGSIAVLNRVQLTARQTGTLFSSLAKETPITIATFLLQLGNFQSGAAGREVPADPNPGAFVERNRI
jgi:hypothetical protein